MDTAIPNDTNHSGMFVRLIQLQGPPAIFAFLHNNSEGYSLLTIISGSAELTFRNRIIHAKVFEIHYLDDDCLIRGQNSPGTRFYVLQFTEAYAEATLYSVLSNTALQLLSNDRYPVIADKSTFKIIRKLHQLLCKHQDGTASPNSATIAELTFNLLFSCIGELHQFPLLEDTGHIRRRELIAMRFFKLVAKNCSIHHAVSFYARELCMSQGNLAKIIRDTTGRSPKALIEDMLVAAAKKYLNTGELTIYVIAEELGFASASAFNNFFKSHSGFTPNEYRNRKKR